MSSVTLDEAQAKLPELIDHLQPGEELLITRNQKPIAKLTAAASETRPQRQLGTMKGSVLSMAPDFDAPLGA